MRFKLFIATAALLSISVAARADTVTYDFTYASTSGAVAGETSIGSGTFSVSYPSGTRGGTLTAFSFTDTIDSSLGDSTISYQTNDVDAGSSNVVLSLGGDDVVLATIIAASNNETNTQFGTVVFTLQDVEGAITGSTSYSGNGNAPDLAADSTTGTGTITFVSTDATPEPSSIVLLSTGLLGVAGVMKRRFV